ncbi:MAG: DUF86 domain-containing protein [Nitrososphaerales archaeon]|nr:DUF86 domain-containing protein [Nitrososphaerales archaeon]
MRVKEWVDGSLILDGDISQGIEEAFKEGRYVEAFALLQAQIDWWMADLHQLCSLKSGKLRHWDLGEMIDSYPFRFNDSLKFLLGEGVLSKKECASLKEFYALRNKIVHRLIMRSYQPAKRNKLTRVEVMKGFEKGKVLAKLLGNKTASYLPFYKQ